MRQSPKQSKSGNRSLTLKTASMRPFLLKLAKQCSDPDGLFSKRTAGFDLLASNVYFSLCTATGHRSLALARIGKVALKTIFMRGGQLSVCYCSNTIYVDNVLHG